MSNTHKDEAREGLQSAIATLTGLRSKIGSPLTWLYVWDTIVDKHENHIDGRDDEWEFKSSLDQVWDDLWADADNAGFTLEYGSEDIHESIDEWLVNRNHLVRVDEDEA